MERVARLADPQPFMMFPECLRKSRHALRVAALGCLKVVIQCLLWQQLPSSNSKHAGAAAKYDIAVLKQQ